MISTILFAAAASASLVHDAAFLKKLQADSNSTWVAGFNERFAGVTWEEARTLLGTQTSHIADHLDETLPQAYYDNLVADADIPTEFDATKNWAGLVHPIRDQQRCGSCWAFSAAETLGDRFSIAAGKSTPVLSPEDLVSCDTSMMGCGGGQLPGAWSYMKETGIATDQCFPYTAGDGTAPACSKRCSNPKLYKAASAYAVNGVSNMQKEIMTHGPVQVAFMVYKSFMSYKSGVYSKKWYEFLPEGGHAVKIVGWGHDEDSGKDYWIVANSWNTTWGLDGYFWIERGSNMCGIEKLGPPYAGLPAL